MKKLLLGFCIIFSLLIVSCNHSNNATDDVQYALQNGWYSFSVGGLSAPPSRSVTDTNTETFVVPYESDVAWWGAYGWALCGGKYLMDGYDYMIQGTEAGKKCLVPGKYLSGFVSDSEPENPTFMKWDDEHHLNSIVVNGDVWNDSNSEYMWYNNDISCMSFYDSKNGCRFTIGDYIEEYDWYAEDGRHYDVIYYTCLDNTEIRQIGVGFIDGAFWRYDYNYKVDYYYMTFFLDLDEEGSGYEKGRIWR